MYIANSMEAGSFRVPEDGYEVDGTAGLAAAGVGLGVPAAARQRGRHEAAVLLRGLAIYFVDQATQVTPPPPPPPPLAMWNPNL